MMCDLKMVFVMLLIGFVTSDKERKVVNCYQHDLDCVTTLFRQAASGGLPDHDIEPTDPITIPDLLIENEGLLITLNSVNVTGLSEQNITEFVLYPDGKSMKLSFTSPLEINAELYYDSDKPIKGQYYMKAVINGIMGPEIVAGELKGTPEAKLTINRNLKDSIFNGDDKLWRKFEDDLNKIIIEKVVPKTIQAVMGNIASIARVLPNKQLIYDM